ncbi:MAG: DUF58 domain-containing protein [Bdellovibrionales bacterium]|nr:DUF58 domain-containing protein [Bdellovibrionales bacterium]
MKQDKERIYIVPTVYGIMYGMGVIVCLFVGAIYSNNLVFLLCFFIMSLFLIGLQQTHANLKNVSLEKIKFSLVEAKGTSSVKVWLKSNDNYSHYQICLKDRKKKYFELNIEQIFKESLSVTKHDITMMNRGIFQVDQWVMYTRFPFGLFHAWKILNIEESLYVYPQLKGESELPVLNGIGDLERFDGNRGEDFSGHVKYQIGESQKHIDWKAVAKGRPLLRKDFSSGLDGYVDLDWQRIHLPYEDRLSQLALWVFLCEQKNIPYKLKLKSEMVEVGLGALQKEKCLKLLAEQPHV